MLTRKHDSQSVEYVHSGISKRDLSHLSSKPTRGLLFQTPEQRVSGGARQVKAKGMTAGCPLAMKGLYKVVTEIKLQALSSILRLYG